MKGFNGTIFAYGQTGTGKTHTMVGDYRSTVEMGVIPRALDQIFEQVKAEESVYSFTYDINVSFIQIYLEMIQDLLDPENADIRI